MAGYERFTVSADPPEPYELPTPHGPPLPRYGSWRHAAGYYSADPTTYRVVHLRFFAKMHQAATDARRSQDRDYGWVNYDAERGWMVFHRGPLHQDRRR